jgi:hypothetical protein
MELHPHLAHATRRLDFLATRANDRSYVEATVVSGMSDDDRQERDAQDHILDALNTATTANVRAGFACNVARRACR